MAAHAPPISMSPTGFADVSVPSAVPVVVPAGSSDRTTDLATLLQSLDEAAEQCGRSPQAQQPDHHETALVRARLGIASGLHTALRFKDSATASHSLRVALGCSSWAAVLQLPTDDRDALEVAALLHDVGKIGGPDKGLLTPQRLAPAAA